MKGSRIKFDVERDDWKVKLNYLQPLEGAEDKSVLSFATKLWKWAFFEQQCKKWWDILHPKKVLLFFWWDISAAIVYLEPLESNQTNTNLNEALSNNQFL